MPLFQKYPKRMRLIIIFATYLIGNVLGSYFLWGTSQFILFICLVLFGFCLVFRPYILGVCCLGLATLFLGYYWAQTHLQHLTIQHPIEYTGQARVLSVKFSKPPTQHIVLQLKSGIQQGTKLDVYTHDWAYEVGTIVEIHARVTPSQHSSDRGRGVIGSSIQTIVLQQVNSPSRLDRFHRLIESRLGTTLPEPYSSLALGLLTGGGDAFDTSFKTDLQRTGTTHLIAVSGYNLTIVALLLQRIGQRKNRFLGFSLAIGSLILYVILAGTNASILRGAIMAFLSLFALISGRITHRLSLILFTAVLLSLLTPLGMLYSLSWQLSFLAFVGIVFLAPLLTPWCLKYFGKLGATIAETMSAELMTLPLILFQFGTFSVVAPLVNAIVLGFVPLAMALSLGQVAASLIAIPLGRIIAWASYPVLFLIIKPIQWLSSMPFAAFQVSKYPFFFLVTSYGIVLGLFLILYDKSQPKKEDSPLLPPMPAKSDI